MDDDKWLDEPYEKWTQHKPLISRVWAERLGGVCAGSVVGLLLATVYLGVVWISRGSISEEWVSTLLMWSGIGSICGLDDGRRR